MSSILYAPSPGPGQLPADISGFTPEVAQLVRRFHRSFPQYKPTPLTALPALSRTVGIRGLFIKDEAWRFGLNAFKVLGGSYAIGRELARRLNCPMAEMSYARLTSPATRQQLGALTFVTATDGNHGRGVAWTAQQLQQRAVVYMPQGTAQERLDNIRATGAEASILPMSYDDAVRRARADAAEQDWIVVQDTAWEGYTDIPQWIMQGYTTMALEAWEQLDGLRPTHILVQAGVGSMAAAVAAFFANVMAPAPATMIVVEPQAADCHYQTARANDGQLHFTTGPMNTMMAGLACGEPNPLAWPILRDYAAGCAAMTDEVAAQGMRRLHSPLPGDPAITAGESGVAGFALVHALLTDPAQQELRQQLRLDENSVVLCFNTEGATDKANYNAIIAATEQL